MSASFPVPDRSDYHPGSRLAEGVRDIGWAEGLLADGRPYRAECWAQDQATILTFFFSSDSLTLPTPADAAAFLEREALVSFVSNRFVDARRMTDASGNALWSVSVVMGDEDDVFARDSIALARYA